MRLLIIFFITSSVFAQRMDSVLRRQYNYTVSIVTQKNLKFYSPKYASPRLKITFRTSVIGTNYIQTYDGSKELYDGLQISQGMKESFRVRWKVNEKYRINLGGESLVLKGVIYYIGFRREF